MRFAKTGFGLVILVWAATAAGQGDVTVDRVPESKVQLYRSPMNGSHRLDWCLRWGQGCGGPAANAFCARQGKPGALHWEIAPDIGARTPTRTIGDNKVCAEAFCDGFASIRCGAEAFAAGMPTEMPGAGKTYVEPIHKPRKPWSPDDRVRSPTGQAQPRPGTVACRQLGKLGDSTTVIRPRGNQLVLPDGYKVERLSNNRVRVWKEAANGQPAQPAGDWGCDCKDCDGFGCYTNIFGLLCLNDGNCDSSCEFLKENPCYSSGGSGLEDAFEMPGEVIQ